MSRTRAACADDPREGFASHPQGAPRGFLLYYILHRVATEPIHGYEILQDIESRTEGAWRPGPGSIYPMLKRMVKHGWIKADSVRESETDQRVYRITPKGQKHLTEAKKMFVDMGKKWSSFRRIFIDMIEPKDIGGFIVDGTKAQFQMTRETVESKISYIPPTEARFILREYALNLERQTEWCDSLLKKLETSERGEVKDSSITLMPKSR